MNQIIEEQFITNEGYLAIVIFTQIGFRCGYLGVPKNHIAAKSCNELPDFDVHGGLNYSQTNHHNKTLPDLHYLGFDCSHYTDAYDIDMTIKYFGVNIKTPLFFEGVIRTQKFVANELRSLSSQIDKLELYI